MRDRRISTSGTAAPTSAHRDEPAGQGGEWIAGACDQLERERIHLWLIEDAKRSLADIEVGRTYRADVAIAQIQNHRAGALKGS